MELLEILFVCDNEFSQNKSFQNFIILTVVKAGPFKPKF